MENNNSAWICPRCETVNSPYTKACDCKPNGTITYPFDLYNSVSGLFAQCGGCTCCNNTANSNVDCPVHKPENGNINQL